MLSHWRGWVLQRKDSGKAAGFQSVQKAGEAVPASVKVSAVAATGWMDSPARRTAKLTESRELFFFLVFFSWLQPEGDHSQNEYSRIDQGSQDDLPQT